MRVFAWSYIWVILHYTVYSTWNSGGSKLLEKFRRMILKISNKLNMGNKCLLKLMNNIESRLLIKSPHKTSDFHIVASFLFELFRKWGSNFFVNLLLFYMLVNINSTTWLFWLYVKWSLVAQKYKSIIWIEWTHTCFRVNFLSSQFHFLLKYSFKLLKRSTSFLNSFRPFLNLKSTPICMFRLCTKITFIGVL